MAFTLSQLENFIVLAEELNFGRAARRLNISQPPLTRQIKALEGELGALLFHRNKRKVELTEAGAFLLRDARALLDQLRMMQENVRLAARGEGGHLSVAFEGVAVYDLIPRSIKAFQDKYPAVSVTLHDINSGDQVKALHQGRIAAGFVSGRVRDRQVMNETVLSEPVTLALPASHPLSKEKVVRLKSLSGDPILMCPRHHNPAMYDQLVALCRRAGFSPRIVHQPAEMQLVLGFIASGLGVAIVPAALQKFRRPDVVYRPMSPAGPPTELSLIYLKASESLLVSRFRDVVKATAAARTKVVPIDK
jgi:DNA-binding transcriptional LysR family regulator